MKKQIRLIVKFAAAILAVQALALLLLTPQGLELLFPPVARVNAEKFSPDSNTYAVYYDTRVEVSSADLIVVGMDFGIAESFDLLGHFTRFVKQYNNLSAILLHLTISQENLVRNLMTRDSEEEFNKRMTVLRERTGMSSDFCGYISELFLINRTMTPVRKMDVLTYAAPTENDYLLNAGEPAALSKAERVMAALHETERSALCVVNCEDLADGSSFRTELNALAEAEGLRVMILQVQYSGTCDAGEGHPDFLFPDYHREPSVFFVNNTKAAWFYRYYSVLAGRLTENRLDTRYTDSYFVVTHGTAAG
ncbi:MAG: hypothetical protein ACI4V1_04230 [Eubacteriales bacterium]